MSNHLISETYKRDLKTHTRKGVMALLADKASDDGGGIYAAKQALADELCTSKQTVIKTINEFVEEGLLEVVGHRGCATGHTVEYRICIEKLHALPYVEYWQKKMAKRSSSLTGQAASPVKHADGRGQAALPKPLLNPIPPTETIVSVCPPGQKQTVSSKGTGKGSTPTTRLPDDWTPPEIEQLAVAAQKMVLQWPAGAYAVVAEGFRLHFTSEAGVRAVKRDWAAAFAKWLINGHSRVMRDAKAGVRFVGAAPSGGAPGDAGADGWHPMRAAETDVSRGVRANLRLLLGPRVYGHWFEQLAIVVDRDGFSIIGSSEFVINWVRENYLSEISQALGLHEKYITFKVERVSNGSQGQQGQARGEQAGADDRGTAAARPGRGDGRDRRAVCA